MTLLPKVSLCIACLHAMTMVVMIMPHSLSAFTTQTKAARKTLLMSAPDNNHGDTTTTTTTSSMTPRRTILKALVLVLTPLPVYAKCTDIESCREIGESKVERDIAENPVTRLKSGARYKVLQAGTGGGAVDEGSNVDLIFSVSTLSGGYMYSRGFGYEKVDGVNGKMVSDAGLDSIRVKMGERNVPVGIQDALIGMKKGERRRVELPPSVGFETSDWQPEPVTKRGKAGMVGYRRILEGNGPNQPPFPAATIWDVEVLRIRK